jgi:hypothetical protein
MASLFCAALLCLLLSSATLGQTTSFTYQGALSDSGTVANGNYDLQFSLWDSVSGGVQIGSTQGLNAVTVANGIFSVTLDFGANAFSGATRFLEISTRPAGAGAFILLSPRQQLTSTPYAIRSLSTTTADTATNASQLGGVAANQYVQTNDSRLSDPRSPTPGSASYIQNTNSQQAANFNINGNGTAAGTLTGGNVNTSGQYEIDNIRVLNMNGSNNAFVGPNAGLLNNGGFRNSFLGAAAGYNNSTGGENAFVGWSSGGNNSTGGSNSFFGSGSGGSNTSGSNNSFFGISAGQASTTSGNNSFFGAKAGVVNTASANSFFGAFAGNANTTGNNNSFFGTQSGLSNTIGVNNSFFGAAAGFSNASVFANAGSNNSYFGAFAGQSNSAGGDNSFFGSSAGKSGDGYGNSFFGSGAGSSTYGYDNAFFGKAAGQTNGEGLDNAFYGAYAGLKNTSGTSNTFVGTYAGNDNTTGGINTSLGFESGRHSTTGFGNTFLGNQTGLSNTTGSNNTTVGNAADVASSNLTFATAIGAGANVATSNTIALGRSNGSDSVRIPGTLTVLTLGSAGSTSLCRNAFNQISTCSSSLRYKKNLQPFTRGLTLLNSLKPITFNWKADGSPDLGFGAEDVAAVEPLLVTHNANGEVEGVKYDRITAVLVNAVKEQQLQIAQQQRELNELRRSLNTRQRRHHR